MKKICKVSDCNNPALAKELCRKHYARLHRHGDENIILKPAGDCNAGFIINENGCHVWQGSLDSDGYARKHINGKTRRLCRVSLEEKLGRPILPGMMALHACNNRACINPDHLREGDNSENMGDRVKSGYRQKISKAKLSQDQVTEIKKLLSQGKKADDIAGLYQVSRTQIYRIRAGECWG